LRKAAERLHVSASAIDRQILKVEALLDTSLFERLPQGLRLTAAGEMLAHLVRSFQHDVDRLRSDIEDLRGLRRGTVAIAMVEGASFAFVPTTLAALHRQHPGIGFELRVAGSDAVVEAVLAGEVDFGLAINPREQPGLAVTQSAAFPLGVVTPPEHPLQGMAVISLSDCLAYPLILPDRSLALRNVIDRALSRLSAVAVPVAACNSIAVMKMLVETGVGIGLMNEINVAHEAAGGRLVFRTVTEGMATPSVLSLCIAHDRQLSKAALAALSAFSAALSDRDAMIPSRSGV
jgi:DNA-binding transcriptional LysR family regulator